MTKPIKDYIPDLNVRSKEMRETLKSGVHNGWLCTKVREPIVSFDQAPCEKVVYGRNNSYIVLGRDRPESIASGVGGRGGTRCGMLDLVVGRGSSISAKAMVDKTSEPRGLDRNEGVLGSSNVMGPSFSADAARIYISQRTDDEAGGIDGYLGMESPLHSESGNKSAIAVKADHVRVVGRQCVRIVAGLGAYKGFGEDGELLSNGQRCGHGSQKIELMAGSLEDLEPAVLGGPLRKYLINVNKIIEGNVKAIKTIHEQLIALNGALAGLTAISGGGPFARNLIKNGEALLDSVTTMYNIRLEEMESLNTMVMDGFNGITSNKVWIT